MLRVVVLCCVVALVACGGDDDGVSGPGGNGGSGAGDDAGPGGSGGTGAGDACADAACAAIDDGWYATKASIDVWWPSAEVSDPGRGAITLYQLIRSDGACSGTTEGAVVSKVCGLRLPIITGDAWCDAHELTFSDAMWDQPTMPRFTTSWSLAGSADNAMLTLNPVTRLIGIDLLDGEEDDAWAPSEPTSATVCEAGNGVTCFPDHDMDEHPGITLTVRTDGDIYSYSNVDESGVVQATEDINYGKCFNGTAYRYRGLPAQLDIVSGGGTGGGNRAQHVYTGLRIRKSDTTTVQNACMTAVGDVSVAGVDLRAQGCTLDPAAPAFFYGRTDDACTASEQQYVDSVVPQFQALGEGDVPGDTHRSLGWEMMGREIDKRPSAGPRVAAVRLSDLSDPEPSCADVRAAAFPAFE